MAFGGKQRNSYGGWHSVADIGKMNDGWSTGAMVCWGDGVLGIWSTGDIGRTGCHTMADQQLHYLVVD